MKKIKHALLIVLAYLFLTQVTVTTLANDSVFQTESIEEEYLKQFDDKQSGSDSKKTDSSSFETGITDEEQDGNKETTNAENNESEPEGKTFDESTIPHFDNSIFNRDMNNIATYYAMMINDKITYLTEDEYFDFESYVNELPNDYIMNEKEIVEVLERIIQRSNIELHASDKSFRLDNKNIDWNNWQKNSRYDIQETPYKTFNKKMQTVGERYYEAIFTYRNKINVTINDTIPYFDHLKETLTIPGRPKRVPEWPAGWVTWSPKDLIYEFGPTTSKGTENGLNQVIYTKGGVPGNFKYQPELNRTEMIYQNKVRIFFNNQNTTVNDIGRVFVLSINNPQVTKVYSVNEHEPNKLELIDTLGYKKAHGERLNYKVQDKKNMRFKGYEVLTNEKITEKRTTKREWNGQLDHNKRAILVYYEPIPEKYQVEFETNGGSKINSQTVEEGSKAKKPSPDPTFDNKRFKGWYIDEKLTTPYDFNEPVNSNLILYAKWESPIVNPEDGDTPITPLDPENQNKTKDGLRIQYVSDFEFGEKKNEFRKEISGHAAGDIVKQNSKEKTVPAFVSVIDDRTLHSNEYQWELRAESGPFKETENETTIDKASILLSDLNYARNLNKKPYAANNTLNISEGSQLLSNNGDTKGGTWSLAFGQLENGKSTGVTIKIPAATAKKNVDYYAIINWELTPSLGGR